jgi:hypothetical protein
LTISNESCDIIRCSDTQSQCLLDSGACFPLVAIIAALAGGAIAGIVVAALLAACLLSGGVMAASQISTAPDEAVTNANPIYHGTGNSGENPLNQP